MPERLWGLGYQALVLRERLRGGLGELDENERTHGLHAGCRGFVVGNGASLRGMDLGRLRGEVVVTVNSFFEHQERLGIKPSAHVFFDDWYFGAGLGELRRFAGRSDPPLTFVPLTRREIVGEVLPSARYFFPAGAFEHNRNLDLRRPIPYFQSVALPALLVALHLGLNPIYLIGCDLDFLSHVVGVSPLRVATPYFYQDGQPAITEPAFDYLGYVAAIERMLLGFRFVRDYLPAGRRVINAGIGGVLDMFERADFDTLFR